MAQTGEFNIEDLLSLVCTEQSRLDLLSYLSSEKPRLRDIFMKRLAMFAIIGLAISIIGMLSENRFSATYLTDQQINQELSQRVD